MSKLKKGEKTYKIEDLYSITEAQNKLKLSRPTIYHKIEVKELESVEISGRSFVHIKSK